MLGRARLPMYDVYMMRELCKERGYLAAELCSIGLKNRQKCDYFARYWKTSEKLGFVSEPRKSRIFCNRFKRGCDLKVPLNEIEEVRPPISRLRSKLDRTGDPDQMVRLQKSLKDLKRKIAD